MSMCYIYRVGCVNIMLNESIFILVDYLVVNMKGKWFVVNLLIVIEESIV